MFIVLDQYYIKNCLNYYFIDNNTINNHITISILARFFEKDRLSYNS